MTNEEKNKTKNVILQEAKKLFSKYGYDGTSIRTIAEKSKVNIAAINYHFGNKHGLYWSIISESYTWLEDGVRKVVEESNSVEELASHLFRFMRSGEDDVRSTMKTLLTEGVPNPDPGHPCIEQMAGDNFGPPGGDIVASFFSEVYGKQAQPKAIEWAVQSLFSSIIHWATMCSTSAFQEIKKQKLSDKDIEENVVHLGKAVKTYMCNQENWKS